MEDDDQPETQKSRAAIQVPVAPIPDFKVGPETGRESPIPDSAGIGNREMPRFPIRPGPGIAVPGPGPPGGGNRWGRVPRAARAP
jgi:hypothetical protein